MATLSTLEALATVHPDCLGIHSDIKALIPERCARVLLDAGFTDCSYGNDECPSYYLEPLGVMIGTYGQRMTLYQLWL